MTIQTFLPDNAPFTEAQRAWLNGFIAGLLGAERLKHEPSPAAPPAAPAAEEHFPWHDPTLALDERMKLAAGRPLERQLMAAMGQLDCGQCGYLCKTYAEAIHSGTEPDLGKCVPGGRDTAKQLKELIALRPAQTAAPVMPAPKAVERGYGRDAPVPARLVASMPLTAAAAEKDTRHVVIDIAGTGLAYEPGDSLGVWLLVMIWPPPPSARSCAFSCI